MPNGMIMIVKVGVTTMITSRVLMTANSVARKELRTLGMSSSMT